MPFGQYSDFAACVADNQDKDDPEAFCAYLHQQTTGKFPNQKSAVCRFFEGVGRLFTADLEKDAPTKTVEGQVLHAGAFAYVGDAGDPSTWKLPIHDEAHVRAALSRFSQTDLPAGEKGAVARKIRAAAERHGIDTSGFEDSHPAAKSAFERLVPIAKIDAEQRLVYGIVYEPDVPDAHNDYMTAGDIEKACHGFMDRYAKALGETGTDHLATVSRDQVVIVENYIAPTALKLGEQAVRKGSWIMVGRVADDALWKDVKAGRYTGWSFEGWGRRIAA